jgi:hypothetical protein
MTGPDYLADVARLTALRPPLNSPDRADLEETVQRIHNMEILLDLHHFLKGGISSAAQVTGIVVITYEQR